MNEITKYKNELNTVPMRQWSKEEMDFFFSILTKAKGQGTKLIKIPKSELDKVAHADKNLPRLRKTLEKLVDHVSTMRYIERTPRSYAVMNLFQWFKIDWNEDYTDYTAEIQVTEKFEYILNKIEDNFTKFPIEEFITLKSTYSKTLYRQLKQFRTTGWREFSLEEFKELLAIPNSYTKQSHIDQKVLTPCVKELAPFFPGLKLKKIHADKRGRPLIGLRFSWKPETSEDWIEGKFEKKSKKKLNTGLPEWYSKTEQKPIDPEVLQKALEAQKKAGEKSKELEGEQLPFDF